MVCDPRLAACDDMCRPTTPVADRLEAVSKLSLMPMVCDPIGIKLTGRWRLAPPFLSLAGGLRPPSGRLRRHVQADDAGRRPAGSCFKA